MGANAMLASGVVGAGSQIAGAVSGANALETQSYIARLNYETNQKIAEFQANDALAQGKARATAVRKTTRGVIGSQRAALAANGVDVGTGTAADIQAETAGIGEIEAIKIGNQAWRTAFGFKSQGAQYGAQAAYEQISGQEKRRTTLLTGGLNALQTGLQTAYEYKKVA